jgi:alkylhydroperoxidase family enzyme
LLRDEALVRAVMEDIETSPLDEKHRALFRFVDRVNHHSPQITEEHLETVRQAGWNDEAIFFAITVCALFNFYNRWVDSSGVHALSDEAHRQGAKRSAAQGYVRT